MLDLMRTFSMVWWEHVFFVGLRLPAANGVSEHEIRRAIATIFLNNIRRSFWLGVSKDLFLDSANRRRFRG